MSSADKPSRSASVQFLIGLALGLVPWGFALIGVTINLWLGSIVLLIAFILVVPALWIWEKALRWHVFVRSITVIVVAAVYFAWVGKQVWREWKLEHRPHDASISEAPVQIANPLTVRQPESGEKHSSDSEIARRKELLEKLRREYILSHDNLSARLLAGTESPPTEWINKRLGEIGENWRLSATTSRAHSDGVQQGEPPVVIQTAPTFGNIKDRAVALSQEIIRDLCLRGWRGRGCQETPPGFVQRMPTTEPEMGQWVRGLSDYFRWRLFERVLDIRNEFAQLHLRDQELDSS